MTGYARQAARFGVVGAVLCLSSLAYAGDAKVSVQADVVFASEKPGTVPDDLKDMQKELAKRVKYLTLKRLDSKKLTLTPTPTSFVLPNKKVAELSVLSLENDVATLQVRVKPADVTYKLGKGKAMRVQAGKHDGGDLWLVLTQPK